MNGFTGVARVLHVLLLSLWLGAGASCAMISSVVTDATGSRDTARAILIAALDHFDVYGLVAGPVVLITLLMGWVPAHAPVRLRGLGTLVMTAVSLASGQYVSPRIARFGEESGGGLLGYGQAHALSIGVLVVQILLAMLLIAGAVRHVEAKQKRGIDV